MLLPPTSIVCWADFIAMVVDVKTTQGVCIVWQVLKPLEQFVQNLVSCREKKNICTNPSENVNIQTGP